MERKSCEDKIKTKKSYKEFTFLMRFITPLKMKSIAFVLYLKDLLQNKTGYTTDMNVTE